MGAPDATGAPDDTRGSAPWRWPPRQLSQAGCPRLQDPLIQAAGTDVSAAWGLRALPRLPPIARRPPVVRVPAGWP